MILVVVESPAKCSKIQQFLGPPYRVEASYGHIRDLAKGLDAVRLSAKKNQYEPKYTITKQKVVTKLKKLSKKADEVIIATDLDREGEAIGFHLAAVLKLSLSSTKRIVFNQITKDAIQTAMRNPRTLDVQMFNAQQARRVLDRMIGFTISPVLWKYVASQLSAGRCQSPALKLIHDRELQRNSCSLKSSFDIWGTFQVNETEIEARFAHTETTTNASYEFLQRTQTAYFETGETRHTTHNQSPPPPFITSSFQQAASNIGISPKQAMGIAQKLYEAGLITYMRTDSVHLSAHCKNQCKNFMQGDYKGYHEPRNFHGKAKQKTQEAHEAIHPVHMEKKTLSSKWDSRSQRLYNLIWKRTMACQMKAHQYQKCVLRINMFEQQKGSKEAGVVSDDVLYEQCKEYATCEILNTTFLGWKVLYEEKKPPSPLWKLLNTVNPNVECTCTKVTSTEKCSQPMSRFTQAQLIKQLEKNNIGRPSTYSSILSSIVDRNYVVIQDDLGITKDIVIHSWSSSGRDIWPIKEATKTIQVGAEKQRMCITAVGVSIVNFLETHFGFVMNLSYTSQVEDELDKIAAGNMPWKACVQKAYEIIQNCTKNLNVSCDPKSTKLSSQRRHLGSHPTTGKPIFVFPSRKGIMIQHGETQCEGTTVSKLPGKLSLESITIDAHLLNHIPQNFGTVNGKTLLVLVGKYGPFIKHGNTNIPLPKDVEISKITVERCLSAIKSFDKKPAKSTLLRTMTQGKGSITIHRGPYGNYIRRGNTIRSVPNGVEITSLTVQDCREILKQPKKRGKRKKK